MCRSEKCFVKSNASSKHKQDWNQANIIFDTVIKQLPAVTSLSKHLPDGARTRSGEAAGLRKFVHIPGEMEKGGIILPTLQQPVTTRKYSRNAGLDTRARQTGYSGTTDLVLGCADIHPMWFLQSLMCFEQWSVQSVYKQ